MSSLHQLCFNLATFFYAECRTPELPIKGNVEYLIENHWHNLSKAVAKFIFLSNAISKKCIQPCLRYIVFSRGTHKRFIMKLFLSCLPLYMYTSLGPAFIDKVATSLPIYLVILYIVLTICHLIGYEPTVNFGNQRNLQISYLTVSRLVTNLQVVHAMHVLQEQCQTAFHVVLCLSLLPSKQCILKQLLLDSVFVTSGLIQVSVSVTSLHFWPH